MITRTINILHVNVFVQFSRVDFQIIKDDQGELKIAKLFEYPRREQLYLELEDAPFRKRNNYTLFLSFNSTLNSTELKGFYFSSYTTPDGENR